METTNHMFFPRFWHRTPKEQALEYYAGALLGDVPEKHKIYSNRQGPGAMMIPVYIQLNTRYLDDFEMILRWFWMILDDFGWSTGWSEVIFFGFRMLDRC